MILKEFYSCLIYLAQNSMTKLKYLITGGTGFLGHFLVKRLLKQENVSEVRIYSRDEFKQSEMALTITDKRVTYWLGDVRNLERLKEACEGMDIIVHAAAMKRMDSVSHNAYEVAGVNIDGTRNVTLAGKDCKRIILISTDKAFHPENVYGASKFIAESIVLANKNGVVWRFGNFLCSRGSVWDIFTTQKNAGIPFTITDPNATRFIIDPYAVCDYVFSNAKPGLHYPEKLKSMTVKEIADSISPTHPHVIIGLRPGEKAHESFSEDYTSKKSI